MLPKQNRLSKKDIEKIFKKNKNFRGEFFILKIRPNFLPFSRFSVIVPLKVSKQATKRNKIKRRTREILRKNLLKIKPGFDGVFIATPKIIGKKYKEIEEEIENLLRLANILEEKFANVRE